MSGRSSVHSSSRPDDVVFRPDPSLQQETSIPACIRLDVSTTRPDASQYSTKLLMFWLGLVFLRFTGQ
jgi:hypothetical protein